MTKQYKLQTLSILSIIFMLLCISFSGCTTTRFEPTVTSYDLIVNISSLDRDMVTGGHFILGSGSINSRPVYFYYVITPNGGYKLKSVPASSSTIFEDENETPYIISHYSLKSGSFTGVDEEFGEVDDETIARYVGPDPNYFNKVYHLFSRVGDIEIHIPKNSIRKEFSP